MRWRNLARAWPLPLLLCVISGLAAITLVSPSGSAGGLVRPQEPPTPRKELVPVKYSVHSDRPSAPGDKVALRQLVIATDANDPGLATWTSILDRIGTPYDVLLANGHRLSRDQLVSSDGIGRYSAILLTSNSLLYKSKSGYVSAFSSGDWDTLWGYERMFDVRQVSLDTSELASPENYCIHERSEDAVGTKPVHATLTSTGASVFDYLSRDVRIPISNAYVYRSRPASGCDVRPLLKLGNDVVGILSTSADGRQRAALQLALEPDQLATALVGYGLVRWATHGVFLGEKRHWLNVDVDDMFNTNREVHTDGSTSKYRLSGPELAKVARQQEALHRRYPLAKDFKLNLAYNGGLIDTRAPEQCSAEGTPDPLTSYSRCLAGHFRWINHTFSHPSLDFTSYEKTRSEIAKNLTAAAAIDLPVPSSILKTPAYSGLGSYSKSPSSAAEPTDHGLKASNKAMLRAASDLGIKYLEGDMSVPSQRPDCFNCGIHHPLQHDIFVVPDWPTNFAFRAINPDEQVRLYSPNGSHLPSPGTHDYPSYDRVLDAESNFAMTRITRGSAYTYTFHEGNLHLYAPGKSLVFDWVSAVVKKYSSYFKVPLKTPDWESLAEYVQARTSHFANLRNDADVVWDRATDAVTCAPAAAGSLFVTGLATRPATDSDQKGPGRAERYGSDSVSRIGTTPGRTVTFKAAPHDEP